MRVISLGGVEPTLPNVSICKDEINQVYYNPYIQPLKFTALNGNSTISFMTESEVGTLKFEISRDSKTWEKWEDSYSEEEHGVTTEEVEKFLNDFFKKD